MRVELEIPENVTVEVDRFDVTVEGPEGAVTRRLWYPDVTVETDDDQVVIESGAEDAKTNSTVAPSRATSPTPSTA